MATNNVFDLTTGLISYWQLSDIQGTSVPDSFGSNTGTATSLSESDRSDGYNHIRDSLTFDGSADFITVSDDTSLQVVSDNYSVLMWLRFTSAANTIIMEKGVNDEMAIQTFSGGIRWAGANTIDSVSTINTNIWYHVVLVASGTSGFIYVNGKLDQTGGDKTQGTPNSSDFIIASRATRFSGDMQDLMIYNRALTQLEIELLYSHQLQGKEI
tara:strand:- start:4446 stop:5084 length:639 start_codon:yes stop_codon:yes gene_type:complete